MKQETLKFWNFVDFPRNRILGRDEYPRSFATFRRHRSKIERSAMLNRHAKLEKDYVQSMVEINREFWMISYFLRYLSEKLKIKEYSDIMKSAAQFALLDFKSLELMNEVIKFNNSMLDKQTLDDKEI